MMTEAPPTIRVLIVDDHTVLSEAIAAALDRQEDIEVVGVAANPWDARALFTEGVDVAVLDVDLGEHNGIELARELGEEHPNTQVLILTGHKDPRLLEEALGVGVTGFATKNTSIDQLCLAIRSAYRNNVSIPEDLLAEMVSERSARRRKDAEVSRLRDALSARELEILEALVDGQSTAAIAESLFLSINTVRTHIQNLLTKIGVHSRVEAVSYAIKSNLVSPPSPDPVDVD